MKVHFLDKFKGRPYCGANSFFLEITQNSHEVTCKVCKELNELHSGKRDELSFGGNKDADGNPRQKTNQHDCGVYR